MWWPAGPDLEATCIVRLRMRHTKSMESDYNEINYPGYEKFKIYGGSKMLDFRAKSFLTKEPTTLESFRL